MSFFLPFSFLSAFFKLRERERERESIQLQYLGGVEGENGSKVYLAFRRVSSESIFLLLRASRILVQNSFRFSPEFRRQFQYIWSLQLLSWNPALLVASDNPSSPGDLCPENWILFPISADEKGASGFRVLANHLASFFFLHPVRRFTRTAISILNVPLLCPAG